GLAEFTAGQRRRHPDPARTGDAAPARANAEPAGSRPDAYCRVRRVRPAPAMGAGTPTRAAARGSRVADGDGLQPWTHLSPSPIIRDAERLQRPRTPDAQCCDPQRSARRRKRESLPSGAGPADPQSPRALVDLEKCVPESHDQVAAERRLPALVSSGGWPGVRPDASLTLRGRPASRSSGRARVGPRRYGWGRRGAG